MEFVALSYAYNTSIATAREWMDTVCRSCGNILVMSWSMYDVPSKMKKTKLSTNPNTPQPSCSPKMTTRWMVASIKISWFEADSRPSLAARGMCFYRDGLGYNQSNTLRAVPVRNAETTGCREAWCNPRLWPTLLRIWNVATMLSSPVCCLHVSGRHVCRRIWWKISENIDDWFVIDGNNTTW